MGDGLVVGGKMTGPFPGVPPSSPQAERTSNRASAAKPAVEEDDGVFVTKAEEDD